MENPPFEDVLDECIDAEQKGLGRKRAGPAAKKYWIDKATPNIKKQLKKMKWADARKRVLPTATKMGAVAAVLTGSLEVVPPWAAEAAAGAVKKDPKCPRPVPGKGRGGFCP